MHTQARHTHARALWHCAPAHTGAVRPPSALCVEPAMARACSQHWVGLDSSGVACNGTSSEEGEEYHDRATVNHEHVQPAGKSELVLTLEAV